MATSKPRKRKQKRSPSLLPMILLGIGLLVLGVAALLYLPKPGSSQSDGSEFSAIPVEVNFPAPDLELTDLLGNPVALADYRGQFVLINNWATWCPPCLAEMPELQTFYDDHHQQNFTLVAIEAGQPAGEVARFVQQNNLTFPVWQDPKNDTLMAFRNQSLPNSYFIDPDGVVRLAWTGAINRENLEKYITPWLED